MRRHIPRICAGVVVLAFFLPWIKVELGPMGDFFEGLAERFGQDIPLPSLSGFDWATDLEHGSPLLFILIAAVAGAALLHQRGTYIGLGILAGLSLLAGPMPADNAASFSYGFFLTIIGILAMMASGVTCLEDDRSKRWNE